jgi:hypothetical protein
MEPLKAGYAWLADFKGEIGPSRIQWMISLGHPLETAVKEFYEVLNPPGTPNSFSLLFASSEDVNDELMDDPCGSANMHGIWVYTRNSPHSYPWTVVQLLILLELQSKQTIAGNLDPPCKRTDPSLSVCQGIT